MLQRILNYWYELEFFSPCWPVNTNEDIDLTKEDLPWQTPQRNPKIRVSYDIYFGKAKPNDLIVWLLDTLNLRIEETSIEINNSLVCLFALKIDERGKYVADSFTISSFIWAICKLIDSNSFNGKLDILELETFQQKVNDWLLQNNIDEHDLPISKDYLYKIYQLICKKININSKLFVATLWSRRKEQTANKDGDFPPMDPTTELMQSFYLKDICKIRKSPTQRIDAYVQSMIERSTDEQRIQIDTDVVHMQQWLKADYFPLGAWPSKYSPSLMQQMGINIAVAGEQNIFSVNGPPGTGKTTLLKEIVVSNIIQRAIAMAGYSTPDNAFKKDEIKNPPDQYNQSFYRPDKILSSYGMIVASNNNAAVENISAELPKAIQKDRTGRFCCLGEETNNTYFSDIATNLIGKPAWGLISAKLGKRSNQKALRERLWWANDAATLKRYYEGEVPDWDVACLNFQTALQAVYDAQNNIAQAQVMLSNQEQAKAKQNAARVKNDEMLAELCLQQNSLLAENQELDRLENELALHQQNITTLKSSLTFLKRVFWQLFRNNAIIREWKQAEQHAQETVIKITRQRTAFQAQSIVVQAALTQQQLSKNDLHQAEQQLYTANTAIAPYKVQFGENWADSSFWQNISENEDSQITCPWTYGEYDKLREELFFQALMLHKAFILNSNCVKQNLMRLFAMWDGKFTASDCEVSYGALLNTLLLVIPVVSTTFASVQSFLEGVQAEELGVLIVDESGQATPQSALGALWRTQKAIIVGDPLQVEPIINIPSELQKRFADENEIPPAYRLSELSVQMLADQLNLYGGIRDRDGEKLWLGCPLIIHRRCLNPMFQISNEVAYNGRMFTKTAEPNPEKKFLLHQSVWFNVKGTEKGNKNHVVQEQVEAVTKLFAQAIDVYDGLPDLYIITPFTSINAVLKGAIRAVIKNKLPKMYAQDIADWVNENCGTIHTFQGKEANEVLLVLGCDAYSGKGAVQWVGQKPNIINVAVSRAKYRLGVIGDYDLWKNVPNVQIVCKYLKPK